MVPACWARTARGELRGIGVARHEHEVAAKKVAFREMNQDEFAGISPKKRPCPGQGGGERGGPPLKRGRGGGCGGENKRKHAKLSKTLRLAFHNSSCVDL